MACIGKFRIGWRGTANVTFAGGVARSASSTLKGEAQPTFWTPNPTPFMESVTWEANSRMKIDLTEDLFPVWRGQVVGVHSAGAPDETSYIFNNVGLHKGILIQDEFNIVRRNVQVLNFMGDDIMARRTQRNNRVDIFSPPLDFQPTLTVSWNGGPYNGLSFAEKGYVGDSLNIAWASNDPQNTPVIAYDQLTLDSNPIVLDPGATIPDGGTYSNLGAIDETFEGSGVSVRLTSALSAVTLTGGIDWLFRSYWGNRAQQTIDAAGVLALANNGLRADKPGLYPIGAAPSNYKWICYPDTYGPTDVNTGFKDDSTGFFVPMMPPITVAVTNGFGVTKNYLCYRSFNQLGGIVPVRIV